MAGEHEQPDFADDGIHCDHHQRVAGVALIVVHALVADQEEIHPITVGVSLLRQCAYWQEAGNEHQGNQFGEQGFHRMQDSVLHRLHDFTLPY